ncbi:Putative amidohydrolase YtcJ [Psilocybe cubensis]|uniref:Amidohydrolase YtcJ n=1 Tax=Psilocybe cubensis TaxID=181762 RepID=A0ACB8HC49_PSICU|nr:Putative amidohydrolase YtcJ [Psilocybe cubensis]KAH9485282.1 Putative amidohydrolase YtcJ [Psilocybe cubensis]
MEGKGSSIGATAGNANDKDKQPPNKGSRGRWALLTGVLSIALGYYFASVSIKPSSTVNVHILCSKEGNKIYTVDDKNSQTQCVVFQGAYVVDTGSLETITDEWVDSENGKISAPYTLHFNFIPPGAIILPGISDSHAHILEYGAAQQLSLEGARSIPDAVARIKEFILSNPDILEDTSKFITGGGWDHTVWPTTGWPSAVDLDADSIVRGRPVVLQSKDCHALWVSNKALEGSLPLPESVEGGIIVRDASGNPTDNAQDLLKQPELTENDLMRRFKVAVRDAHRYGITSIHDAGLDPKSLAFFKRQSETGTLPLRIYGMTYFHESEPYWGNLSTPIMADGNSRLSARSVKIFADGALRTGGAALYEPYADNPSTNGFMRLDPDILFNVIPKFLKDGWQVNVHAIGDRANGIVLDAFEASLKGVNVTALRPRLEHAQMMTQADMLRLGKLGVIASVQPTHAISDMWYAQDRLGPERVKRLYAFRSLVDSGAMLTLGSDAPVETLNPISNFYAAITRKSFTGESPHGSDGWFPEQKLSRIEALRGMTINPAFASFTETFLGSIEVGKRADFSILSQDIMTVPTEDILATKVLATIIDGQFVFGKI